MVFRYLTVILLMPSILLASQDSLNVKKKDSKSAFAFSLIPGMGQAYNGKWIKSALVIGLEVTSFVSWQDNLKKHRDYDLSLIHI